MKGIFVFEPALPRDLAEVVDAVVAVEFFMGPFPWKREAKIWRRVVALDAGIKPEIAARLAQGWSAAGGQSFFFLRRVEKKRAVFRHDKVEQIELGERQLQIRELPPGYEHELPARTLDLFQGFNRCRIDTAILREGAV